MRITMLTVGSRGDVQPYVALGRGFRDAGHTVRLATHAEFEPFVREHGLEFAPVSGNPRELLETDAGQKWLGSQSNPVAFARHFQALAEPLLWDMMRDSLRATEDADLIVASTLGLYAATPIAEKRRIPFLVAPLQPLQPSRYVTNPVFPPPPGWLPFTGVYNRFSFLALETLLNWVFGGPLDQIRRDLLQLPRRRSRDWLATNMLPIVYGFSRHVIPKPPDWRDQAQVCGYWFLDEGRDYEPPDGLRRFLDAGPAPVYIGFGSMKTSDPQATARLVLEALDRSGQRGILLTGWGGLSDGELPGHAYAIHAIPHDWLFPRMAAVVHHGGAGTTAAGLRAGVPSILIPFFADQPFWASRVRALGVGPRAIPRNQLTAEQLAAAIRQAVDDTAMRQRAAALGAAIRAEDGVARAVDVLERLRPTLSINAKS